MADFSLADLKAVMGDENGMGGGWLWLIVLLLFFRGGALGGECGRTLTEAEYQNGQNFRTVDNQLMGISNGICSSTYELNKSITSEGRALQQQVADCCCNTQLGIANLAAQGDKNTCAITTAIHAEGEATRAMIRENEIQSLRDKVSELTLAQSQCAQNNYLTSVLRPYPNPAYIVGSPYASAGNCFASYNGCC